MWFKNLKLFRLNTHWTYRGPQLLDLLKPWEFVSASSFEQVNLGFLPVTIEGLLAHFCAGHCLLNVRAESKLLPSSVIKQFANLKAKEVALEQGYKPGRKQMKDIRDEVTDHLRAKAFSVYRDTFLWINPELGYLVIDSASTQRVDEILGFLSKVFSPLPFENVNTVLSPISAMTRWLLEGAPKGFTIDEDAELSSVTQDKAKVRYIKHPLVAEDCERHIQEGKVCTKLAMTWEDKISFVLTDTLDIKRISPLNVMDEHQDFSGMNEIERFDADMTLMCLELSGLINALVLALGGLESR